MSAGPSALAERIAARLAVPIDPAVAEFARALGDAAGARAVLFYGSNLRTGSLEGVLDFYILLPGTKESAIWPTVSYHERDHHGVTLRAKVATMRLATFARATSGDLTDTTIWARFVQPSALIWAVDDTARSEVIAAIASAAKTAARLAAALGPTSGTAEDYWRALFRATYSAEFRVEKSGRENDILSVNAEHFAGLLPLALEAGGIPPGQDGTVLTPQLPPAERARILSWWKRRRRMGKPLNLLRLVKASTTFEGAARYAAWKIERHTGMPVAITPFRERFPLLAAPQVLLDLRRHRRRQRTG
ncbi:hypothetical protein GVM20_08575 [Porphyrobacter sp. SLTP]|uniref:hypothetical protein n=1 Tax=Porphyrobacter sp. SLTP TaxID=2683266 RepID=UPI001413532D|nr:hypothetical protein [Porphyrobacter sp. SLTP]NBB25176.1 hypothetical protein [Porphyrobacter sp. SLTP]